MAARAVSSQPASAEMSTSDCRAGKQRHNFSLAWNTREARRSARWGDRAQGRAAGASKLPIRAQQQTHTAQASPPCLQDAQRVVQHALGVGQIVGDGQRQAPQVRLQQQCRLAVRVVCGGAWAGRQGGMRQMRELAGRLDCLQQRLQVATCTAMSAAAQGSGPHQASPCPRSRPTCGAAVNGPPHGAVEHHVELIFVVAHGELVVLGGRAQHGQQGLRRGAGARGESLESVETCQAACRYVRVCWQACQLQAPSLPALLQHPLAAPPRPCRVPAAAQRQPWSGGAGSRTNRCGPSSGTGPGRSPRPPGGGAGRTRGRAVGVRSPGAWACCLPRRSHSVQPQPAARPLPPHTVPHGTPLRAPPGTRRPAAGPAGPAPCQTGRPTPPPGLLSPGRSRRGFAAGACRGRGGDRDHAAVHGGERPAGAVVC